MSSWVSGQYGDVSRGAFLYKSENVGNYHFIRPEGVQVRRSVPIFWMTWAKVEHDFRCSSTKLDGCTCVSYQT